MARNGDVSALSAFMRSSPNAPRLTPTFDVTPINKPVQRNDILIETTPAPWNKPTATATPHMPVIEPVVEVPVEVPVEKRRGANWFITACWMMLTTAWWFIKACWMMITTACSMVVVICILATILAYAGVSFDDVIATGFYETAKRIISSCWTRVTAKVGN